MSVVVIIVSSISSILVALLTKNKLTDLLEMLEAKKKNHYILTKAKSSRKIDDLLNELRLHYKVDRTILYYLHNGQSASNGYSFYKFSCLSESIDKRKVVPKKDEQQGMPIGLMMDFFVHYVEEGMVVCPSYKEYKGSIKNMSFMLQSLSVKSTYSHAFKDLKGNITCFLVMNGEVDTVSITDFDYFNQVGTIIGELMTEKK